MSSIPDYDWPKVEAQMIKAVWNGGSDTDVNKRVIKHLVEIICAQDQIGLDPENPQMTAFNAGRRWVARQLQLAITLPIDQLVREEHNESRTNRVSTATERVNAAAAAGYERPGAKRSPGRKLPGPIV